MVDIPKNTTHQQSTEVSVPIFVKLVLKNLYFSFGLFV